MKKFYFNDGYYVCESSEDKPTEDIEKFAMLIEVDTAKIYYFDGTEWKEFGAEGVDGT